MLLLFSIVVNYSLARLLTLGESRNKRVLVIGLTFNLGLLAYFKYAGFLAENILHNLNAGIDASSILLPIGISFFTFQQIAYLIDVYRGIKTRYTFSEYGLFVSFFPQLIAGPIVHHREMMPQFLKLNWKDAGLRIAIGLSLIIFGLFKKVILADNVAEYSTPVFEMADSGVPITLLPAWIGALGFSLQIYFDFSGYTDIAIGLGTLYGIKLPINFFSPYKADSIIDFWRRWHISLSRFLDFSISQGLPVHSTWGESSQTVREYRHHYATWRFMAWRSMDLCSLGRLTRNLPHSQPHMAQTVGIKV